ncbi:hypothetical protein ACI797_08595 [Geodermatophilus sp. SYSU D00691]
MTNSGDTQVLPRIPVPGAAGPAPTVALTIAEPAPVPVPVPVPQQAAAPATETLAADEAAAEEAPVEEAPAEAAAAEDAPAEEGAEAVVEMIAGPPVESHERIYEEAMATIAALASSWASAVERTTGRHRSAA